MLSYATKQEFGTEKAKQRVSMGRAVLLCWGSGDTREIVPGTVLGADPIYDAPVIKDDTNPSNVHAYSCKAPPKEEGKEIPPCKYPVAGDYFDARSEADLDKMTHGQWAFPPRV